jgi:hypothetical protein
MTQRDSLENPLIRFYEEVVEHTGPERYTMLQVLSQKYSIWPRKLAKKQGIIEGEDYDAVLGEFMDLVLKKLMPSYSRWETEDTQKMSLTFSDFIDKLDVFYQGMEKGSSKDGKHFLRKPTTKFREKYNLTETTLFGTLENQQLHPFYCSLMESVYGLAPLDDYIMGQDKIQVDHVISCQVLSSILTKIDAVYSYDRFYSWKSWINKCWNFLLVPAKINGRKGQLEKRICQIIREKFQGESTFQSDWDTLILAEQQMLEAYFKCFLHYFTMNAKKSWLNQTQTVRKGLLSFFHLFQDDIELKKEEYICTPVCFCRKKNQSKIERHRTFHLFCEVSLPEDLTEFSNYWQKTVSEQKKPPKKQQRQKEYKQKREKKIEKKEKKYPYLVEVLKDMGPAFEEYYDVIVKNGYEELDLEEDNLKAFFECCSIKPGHQKKFAQLRNLEVNKEKI